MASFVYVFRECSLKRTEIPIWLILRYGMSPCPLRVLQVKVSTRVEDSSDIAAFVTVLGYTFQLHTQCNRLAFKNLLEGEQI